MTAASACRRALAMVIALLAMCTAQSDTHESLDARLAREPAELVTSNGRTFRGILDGVRDGRLHLRRAADGGEVGYSFAPQEIARLALPGRDFEVDALEFLERDDTTAAIPLLEALARHRMRYLPVLDPSARRVLWELVRHGGGSGDPGTVAATVRALRPLVSRPDEELQLTECELALGLRHGTPEEYGAIAARLCSLADPAGPSALGWRVLAESAYEEGDYEQTRWLALQPITFGGHRVARDLELCYALAIAAADRLGDVAHARLLATEMQHRGLDWPASAAFAGLGAHYRDAGTEQAVPFFPRTTATGPRPPAPRTSAPFEAARKLTTIPDALP